MRSKALRLINLLEDILDDQVADQWAENQYSWDPNDIDSEGSDQYSESIFSGGYLVPPNTSDLSSYYLSQEAANRNLLPSQALAVQQYNNLYGAAHDFLRNTSLTTQPSSDQFTNLSNYTKILSATGGSSLPGGLILPPGSPGLNNSNFTDISDYVKTLKSVTSLPTQQSFLTYRGLNSVPPSSLQIGDRFSDKSFVPTTLNRNLVNSAQMNNGSRLMINIPPGTLGHYIEPNQFLLHPGTTFRVLGSTSDGFVNLAIDNQSG